MIDKFQLTLHFFLSKGDLFIDVFNEEVCSLKCAACAHYQSFCRVVNIIPLMTTKQFISNVSTIAQVDPSVKF